MGIQKRLNTLGKKIRDLRIEHNFSQEELAEKANLSREHISCIERGKYPINISNLYKIADAFEIDIKTLL
jgi:transcriptional regulator with XRE-family HTH domain